MVGSDIFVFSQFLVLLPPLMRWSHEKSQLQYVGFVNIVRKMSYITILQDNFPNQREEVVFSTFPFLVFPWSCVASLKFAFLR